MYGDDSGVVAVLLLGLLAVVLVVWAATSATSGQSDMQAAIEHAMASGAVTRGMTESQVIRVWGEPAELETETTTELLLVNPGAAVALGVLEGINQAMMSPLERAIARNKVTLHTYRIWIYHSPWRTVTFNSNALVVDWSPKQ